VLVDCSSQFIYLSFRNDIYNTFILDNTFLLCLYHLHLNREEGTVSTAFRNCGSEGSACGWRCNAPPISGSFEFDPGVLRPSRSPWQSNLSGKLTVPPRQHGRTEGFFQSWGWTPCDLGQCKSGFKAKIASFQVRGFVPFLLKSFSTGKEPHLDIPLHFFPRGEPP
jgi:hypothetical protein